MKQMLLRFPAAFTILLPLLSLGAFAQTFPGVLTWHNDNLRTGQNLQESILNSRNLNANTFGKLFSYKVDGQVYAQPLYAPSVNAFGQLHNVVYVATEHDSVYAFDADGVTHSPLWQVTFTSPPAITTMPCTSGTQVDCDPTIIAPERGITATPVIDLIRGKIYVIAKTVENGNFTYRLHALELSTGEETAGSPAMIQAVAPGHPQVAFNPVQELDRAAQLIVNGTVFVAFNSNDSDHGWLLGYNADTLSQSAVFCVTPTGSEGGIWNSGAGPAADSQGYIYLSSGNGTFDVARGGSSYGMSVVKLALTSAGFVVADYFTPFNEAQLSNKDFDLASGGIMLLPDQPGNHSRELTTGFKTGRVFLLDRDNLGGFDPAMNHVLQTILPDTCGYWSSPAYWNGNIYWAGGGTHPKQFSLRQGKYSVPAVSEGTELYDYPGATFSISADGSGPAIAWAIQIPGGNPRNNPPAILHAYDASDLAQELYNSAQAGSRDQAGPAIKMAVPTVANGRVYVGTQAEVDVYGLLNGARGK